MEEIQGWDAWAEKYKPITNKLNGQKDNYYFETYGAELDFVKLADPNHVWTRVQGDFSDLLVAGLHYVNRLEYCITEVPWEDDMTTVLLSVEKECECYDEDGYDNGEYGSPDCEKCEGYGYITEYVG